MSRPGVEGLMVCVAVAVERTISTQHTSAYVMVCTGTVPGVVLCVMFFYQIGYGVVSGFKVIQLVRKVGNKDNGGDRQTCCSKQV